MYPTCVSSKLCEFIYCETILCNHTCASDNQTVFESVSSVFVSRVKVSTRPSKAAISTALGESPSWASGSSLCVYKGIQWRWRCLPQKDNICPQCIKHISAISLWTRSNVFKINCLPVIQKDLHKFSFPSGCSKLEQVDAKIVVAIAVAPVWSVTLEVPIPVQPLLQHLEAEIWSGNSWLTPPLIRTNPPSSSWTLLHTVPLLRV